MIYLYHAQNKINPMDTVTNVYVGECGVCCTILPSDANHAYTRCKHLFCVPCLLKWHKNYPNATCPMCRTPFYSDEEEEEEEDEDEEADAFEREMHQRETNETNRTVRGMNMDIYEEVTHDHMLEIIEQETLNYCRNVPSCGYMGRINLHVIPKEDYERIDIGFANPHSFYIIELMRPRSNWHRYHFGRIEEIISHHLCPNIKWCAFRERINHIHDENEDRAQITTEWANEIQHVAMDDVRVLMQYLPKIRLHA